MAIHLTNSEGLAHLIIERDQENGWIYAHWSGVQTLDLVQTAAFYYLELLREAPCARLLNDHTEVIGRFMEVNDWIAKEWAPMAVAAGLRYVGQVMPIGAPFQPSVQDLSQRLMPHFTIGFFERLPEAQLWLRNCQD